MSELLDKYKKKEDKLFEKVCREMCELHAKKNAAYGNAFAKMFEKSGLRYASDKVSEKVLRIDTLTRDAAVDDMGESVTDSLFDLACYAVMALVELEKRKE